MEARECTALMHQHLHALPDLRGEGEQPLGYGPEVVRYCLRHHEVLWLQCSQVTGCNESRYLLLAKLILAGENESSFRDAGQQRQRCQSNQVSHTRNKARP